MPFELKYFDLPSFLLLILFVSVLFLYFTVTRDKKLKWPPGPKGIPFIGFLIYFVQGKNYPKRLLQLKQKYGKIATVQMGSFKCIFLNDYHLIKKAWSDPRFCSRPAIPATLDRTSEYIIADSRFIGGIIFNSGENFTKQRRFALITLKEMGMGNRNIMESLIQEEVIQLIQKLKQAGSKPLSTRHNFHIASLNALWRITTGKKIPDNDLVISHIAESLGRNLELNHGAKAGIFMPWLTKLFPSLSGWTQYVKESNEIYRFWLTYARQRMKELDTNPIPDSFVHAYLTQARKSTDLESLSFRMFADYSLACVLQDLFVAGMETVSTTLSWSFLLLAIFPEVQDKLYNEIKNIIGDATVRIPSLADRNKMLYTEATIHEILRFSSLAPLGFLHTTTEDVEFAGYNIPKDTIILSNISAIHNDPEYWGDPENFRPERWINQDNTLIRHESYLPFSYGKRQCIGENLAKDELFLFITGIIQVFKVKVNDPPESLIPNIGVSAVPKPHTLRYYERTVDLICGME